MGERVIPIRLGQNWSGPVVGEVVSVEQDEKGIKATVRIDDPAAVERYFGMEAGEFGSVSGVSLGFATTPPEPLIRTYEEGEL